MGSRWDDVRLQLDSLESERQIPTDTGPRTISPQVHRIFTEINAIVLHFNTVFAPLLRQELARVSQGHRTKGVDTLVGPGCVFAPDVHPGHLGWIFDLDHDLMWQQNDSDKPFGLERTSKAFFWSTKGIWSFSWSERDYDSWISDDYKRAVRLGYEHDGAPAYDESSNLVARGAAPDIARLRVGAVLRFYDLPFPS